MDPTKIRRGNHRVFLNIIDEVNNVFRSVKQQTVHCYSNSSGGPRGNVSKLYEGKLSYQYLSMSRRATRGLYKIFIYNVPLSFTC